MYENIKYDELKNLPDDQKVIALNKLKEIYTDNKAIAEATGAAPIAISNMIKKHILGEHVGRTKANKNETTINNDTIVENKETANEPIREKRKYTRKIQPEIIKEELHKDEIVKEEEPVEYETQHQETISNKFSFTTGLCGEIEGEVVKSRITGITNSLLDDKKYLIELKISEL